MAVNYELTAKAPRMRQGRQAQTKRCIAVLSSTCQFKIIGTLAFLGLLIGPIKHKQGVRSDPGNSDRFEP